MPLEISNDLDSRLGLSASAYLEYIELKDQCMIEPSVLYINESHEFLSAFKYFALSDGLIVKVIKGETRIC